jgi:hypothetical protein
MTLVEGLLADELKGDDTPKSRKALVAWLLRGDERSYNYYYKEVTEGRVSVVSSCHFRLLLLNAATVTGTFPVLSCLCDSRHSLYIHLKYCSS